MVALLFTVNVVDRPPWAPVNTAPGVLLQVYPPGGMVGGTDAVIVPPEHIVAAESVIAGGGRTAVTFTEVLPTQPSTVCDAFKVHGAEPVN